MREILWGGGIKIGSQSVYTPFLCIYIPKSLSVHLHLSTGTTPLKRLSDRSYRLSAQKS